MTLCREELAALRKLLRLSLTVRQADEARKQREADNARSGQEATHVSGT
jgi:hypothetical protein